tara:strand:- start:466 stop:1365 length:900 start_codon:yes stop_codon:yes gene_type:complete
MKKSIAILSFIFSLTSCSDDGSSLSQTPDLLSNNPGDIQSSLDTSKGEVGEDSYEIDTSVAGKDSEASLDTKEPEALDTKDTSESEPPEDSFNPEPEDSFIAEEELVCPEGSEAINAETDSGPGYSFTTPQNLNYTFECNLCPGGRDELDGLYRYYTPLNAEGECIASNCCKPNEDCGANGVQNETFLFEGSQWTRVTNVVGPPPGVYGGYYFCPEAKALNKFKEPALWTEIFVFETLPSQSQLTPGYSNPCHIEASGENSIFFECNPQWNTSLPIYYDLNFCKVGTVVDGFPCTDPFE